MRLKDGLDEIVTAFAKAAILLNGMLNITLTDKFGMRVEDVAKVSLMELGECEPEKEITVSGITLSKVAKYGKIEELSIKDDKLQVKVGKATIKMPLMERMYIMRLKDYEPVGEATLSGKRLLSVLKFVGQFSAKIPLQISKKGVVVNVSGESAEIKELIECETKGEAEGEYMRNNLLPVLNTLAKGEDEIKVAMDKKGILRLTFFDDRIRYYLAPVIR